MADTEVAKCPWCGETPDVSNDASFRLTDGVKYGALQCCAIGPEVRTDYKDVPHWRERAIAAWNDRKALASRPAEVDDWISVEDRLPKDYERVLVLKDCGDGSLHSYAVGFVDRQSKECWFADGYSGSLAYVGYRVTHWRALPAPSHTTNKEK